MRYRIDRLKLHSKLNQRIHWAKRMKQARLERALAYAEVKRHALPCVVQITRVAPRMLDDDNLAGSCKSVRDGIADRLGIDDRDEAVEWRYAQRKGTVREYAVEIEIFSVPAHDEKENYFLPEKKLHVAIA